MHPMGTAHHVAGAAAPPRNPYDADIIILALDRPDETCDAIRSALEQTGLTRHVIVVDQGSRPENLRRIAGAARDRADCTLVRLDRNRGVAAGRNAATALGNGRVIIALDNDAEFATPATAATAVAALDAAPTLGAIGFRILAWGGGADDHSSWGYPPRLRARADGTFDAATFVGAGHAIRRAAWEMAGPYDEALFFCWEEYDWCLRAIARGWTVRYRGDIAVLHKVSPQRRVTWSSSRWFHYVRNRLYIHRKHGGSWLGMTPRVAGYAVRGLRNGLLQQTVRGLAAGVQLARRTEAAPLPPFARAYMRRNDRAHRGTLLGRVRDEVLPALSASPTQARWASLSRSSSLNTGGSSTR